MRRGADDLLIALDVGGGEAEDILPGVAGQPTGGVVKTILCVRLFHIDLHTAVGLHLGVDDLRFIVQR